MGDNQFRVRRATQLIKESSTEELQRMITAGLAEALLLITDKPPGYAEEIKKVKNTLDHIKLELNLRGIN